MDKAFGEGPEEGFEQRLARIVDHAIELGGTLEVTVAGSRELALPPGVLEETSFEELRDALDSLVEEGVIVKRAVSTVPACPECDSLSLAIRPGCPDDASADIVRGEVVEHTTCGHMDMLDKLRGERSMCSRCGEHVNPSSMKEWGNWIFCRTCRMFHEKPGPSLSCLECDAAGPWGNEELPLKHLYTYTMPGGSDDDRSGSTDRASLTVIQTKKDDRDMVIRGVDGDVVEDRARPVGDEFTG